VSAVVSALVLAVGLLCVVVVDLLRQHGRILRVLHELDGGEDQPDADPAITLER
jgi:hypothetical protein